jgi:hypothetical protein
MVSDGGVYLLIKLGGIHSQLIHVLRRDTIKVSVGWSSCGPNWLHGDLREEATIEKRMH